jgi:LuxR family transcriptional regulator
MSSKDQIFSILADLQTMAPAGYALAFHIRYTTPQYVFQTYAKDWISHYNKNGLVLQDPIVAWTFANTGTCRWSDLETNDPAGVLDKAKAFGMQYGIALGIEANNSKTVCGFARSDREFTDSEAAELSRLCVELHELTAETGPLDAGTAAELRRLSIEYTHSS